MLPQAAQFVLLPIYTRFLSPADYGIINSMQVIAFLLTLLFTLAIDRAIFRLYFEYKTDTERRNYLGTISIGLIITSVPILGLLFLLKNWIGLAFESIDFYPFYALVILTSFFHIFFLVPKASYYVKEKAKGFVFLSLLEFIVKNIFIIILVVFIKESAVGYLKGQLFGVLTLLPIFIYITLRNINIKFDLSMFKGSLRFSLPILPTLLTVWVITLSDRIFIERYYDLHDVGVYSLGYRIAGLSLIIVGAFHKAYVPFFFKTATELDEQNAKKTLGHTNLLYSLLIIVSCFCIAFFSKEVIFILFDSRYIEAYKIISIVCLARLIGLSAGLFQIAFYQEKKTLLIMWISITAAFVTILLNFILIPIYGVYGAAWAAVSTSLVVFIIKFYFYKKSYYIKIRWNIIMPTFLGLIALFLLMTFINLNIYLSLSIKLLIVMAMIIFIWFKYKKIIVKFIPQRTLQ